MKKYKIFKTLTLSLLFYSPLSYAQIDNGESECDDLLEVVAENLNLKEDIGQLTVSACKKIPNEKNISIVSFAFPTKNEYIKDFFITMVDSKSKQVVATYREKFEEDAFQSLDNNSVSIDTANYRLNPSTRAFGIDISPGRSASCAEGGIGIMRTLYVREGKSIRPIMDGIYLSTWNFIKGENFHCTDNPSENNPVTAEYRTTISIADTSTNGFKDLILNIKSTHDDGSPPVKSTFFKMVYDGKKYNKKAFDTFYQNWQNGK